MHKFCFFENNMALNQYIVVSDYPDIFFQLRQPLVEPAAMTRENSWIISSLAEEMDLLPEVPESLYQAAQKGRRHFGQELSR